MGPRHGPRRCGTATCMLSELPRRCRNRQEGEHLPSGDLGCVELTPSIVWEGVRWLYELLQPRHAIVIPVLEPQGLVYAEGGLVVSSYHQGDALPVTELFCAEG